MATFNFSTDGLPVIQEPIIRVALAIGGVFTPVLAKHSKRTGVTGRIVGKPEVI